MRELRRNENYRSRGLEPSDNLSLFVSAHELLLNLIQPKVLCAKLKLVD